VAERGLPYRYPQPTIIVCPYDRARQLARLASSAYFATGTALILVSEGGINCHSLILDP